MISASPAALAPVDSGGKALYLRLLDVPLPVVFGRTADENPFA
jgi:hypothetical protein